ncbi:MAG: SHOCT domain-containing protein [Haloarculaceae archaeon]
MGFADWASENLLAAVALTVAFGTVLAVSVLGIAGWVLLALLDVGAASTLGSLLPLFVVGLVVGFPVTLVAGLAAVFGLAARASSAVSGKRLGRLASYVERESDVARAVGLADLVEGLDGRSPEERADDRIGRLKEKYVEGKLSERAFERRMGEVLDEEGVDRDRVGGDREYLTERE